MTAEPFAVGQPCPLGEEAAHHLRVRRLDIGERIGLRDGAGRAGAGTLVRLARHGATVEVDTVETVDPPPPVHLLVPVADRDRMLWLAEKATELGAASWRPIVWRRSRSVANRGEGKAFAGRLRGRMEAALAQSGGAWLPAVYPEAPLDRALTAVPAEGSRAVLHAGGETLATVPLASPAVLAIGPEGGMEADELAALEAAGFVRASLGGSTLRFETAAVGALAVAVARLHPPLAQTAPTS